jgi:hypothetical protein
MFNTMNKRIATILLPTAITTCDSDAFSNA